MPERTSDFSKSPSRLRRWASPREAADYLGVSTRTIRQMGADGRIRLYRNGKRLVRIDLDELDASMQPGGAR
ncbi:DNA-binding protein [Mycobacterium heckeshornense]|uniref:Uncharacterized protein n=1 Tax=Mycobacterium heckeshornense TaxID=110505 RepID=A0A2G8B432_9MYCO|nr:excisionase family DNA-binding protein [Mycobacterium heckeshornense]KMV22380.1 DNA-binding protein [Mycobacterium heckeshornense]MCV7034807.1 excisionase family DNA-binding protein [Mycobacterium heckeshornense]PIJ32503.1 DNA-binding protein [Mycobacterium heckeshornense]BCO36729.1 hypothetical protein MHEC_31620 [Mycobacterium heckeshornense]